MTEKKKEINQKEMIASMEASKRGKLAREKHRLSSKKRRSNQRDQRFLRRGNGIQTLS